MSSMTTVSELIAEARSWIGTEFRHQGRSELAVDCAGIGVCLARKFGLGRFEHLVEYRREPDPRRLIAALAAEMDPVRVDRMRPGHVLVLADDRFPSHLALLTEKDGVPHIIHASGRLGEVVEEPFTHEWPRKVRRVFAFRGLEDESTTEITEATEEDA